jgi:hypothetical protein
MTRAPSSNQRLGSVRDIHPMARLLICFSLAGTCFAAWAGSPAPSDPPIPGIPTLEEDLPESVSISVDAAANQTRLSGGGLAVTVEHNPFSFKVSRQSDGAVLLETVPGGARGEFASISSADDHGFTWNRWYWGYRGYRRFVGPWTHAVRVADQRQLSDRCHFVLDTYSAGPGGMDKAGLAVLAATPLSSAFGMAKPALSGARAPMLFVVGPFYRDAVRLAVAVSPTAATFRRLGCTFVSAAGDRYVRFGERFNGVDQRGKTVRCWAEEGGIEPGFLRKLWRRWPAEYTIPGGEDASYAPMPFFLSNRGYGLLADAAEPTRFDLGCHFPGRWRVEAEADHLSLIVFAGPTPAKCLEQFTARVGRVQIPHPWVFAPWNMLTGYRQGGPLEMARLFREKDIPSSVAPDWHSMTPVCSWLGKEADVRQANARLHTLGFKSLCYLQPHVDRDAYRNLWAEGKASKYFVQNASGDPYDIRVFVNVFNNAGYHVGLVDFTREGVDAWWHRQLASLVGLGFDGTMYDFGEYVPPNARFADGRDAAVRNY